jgi:hypothetical protein
MTQSASLLTVEEVGIDELRPDPANPRRIGEDELESLTRSLRQFGFVQPVLARREDRTVVGGHQRLVAARRLGLDTVPVTWLDISVERARLGLALNKIRGPDDQLLAASADLRGPPASTYRPPGRTRSRACGSTRERQGDRDVRPRDRARGGDAGTAMQAG